jgi:hypothetical protein
MGFFRWFRWLIWGPRYQIISSQSFASAEEAAASAKIKMDAAGGEPIAIAADALCCGGETKNTAEWNVYVLIKH